MNALTMTHQALKAYLKEGMSVIDATVGRGYDTRFVAEIVGKSGNVSGFDIQREALDSAAKLLEESGLSATLIHDSHANMAEYFDEETQDAIVFNLGYLPKGDHSIYTRFESTSKAIESGLKLLKRGGLMTVCVYYGGDSGYEERDRLLPYLAALDDGKYQVIKADMFNWKNDPPIAIFILKL